MNPNLEMEVNQTQAGVYTVTYGYKEAPLDVQEKAFADHGFYIVSPALLGFLRAKEVGKGIFGLNSRTSTDVFYDDRDQGRVVIVPSGLISHYVGIDKLVAAHRQGREYVIPIGLRDYVYYLVDYCLRKGIAIVAPHGKTRIQTSEFGKTDLTSRLFSEKVLGIEAQEYGTWLQSQRRRVQLIYLDSHDHATSQDGPYVNRLRVCDHFSDVNVIGSGMYLDGDIGAFGVRLETTAEGGAKN